MRDISKKIIAAILVSLTILMILHTFHFFDKVNTFKNKPLTQSNNKIWTYLEKEYTGTDRVCLPYNNAYRDIPVFFKYCSNLLQKYDTVVVTPENIRQYLSEEEIPFKNEYSSKLSFKNRSDLIGAALLYKYGGLFVERGTIILKDPTPVLQKLELYDLVTFGLARNPPAPSCCSVENMPNNQILASKPNNPVLKIYSKKLYEYCTSGTCPGGNFDNTGTNALSKSIIYMKEDKTIPNEPKKSFNVFNFGAEYDGTRDSEHRFVGFNRLLGSMDIDFVAPESLYFISTPANELYSIQEYSWFLNLSEKQFNESDIYVVHLLKEKLGH